VDRSPSAHLIRGDTKALRIPYRAPRAHSKWPAHAAHTRDSRGGGRASCGARFHSALWLSSTNLQGAGCDSHLPAANGRGCRRGRCGPQSVGMTHETPPENEASGAQVRHYASLRRDRQGSWEAACEPARAGVRAGSSGSSQKLEPSLQHSSDMPSCTKTPMVTSRLRRSA